MPGNSNSNDSAIAARLDALEEKLATTEKILSAAKVEILQKDQIIEALKNRLFGQKTERYDHNQLQFDFGEQTLGKPEPEETGDQGNKGKESGSSRSRSKKRDLFPKNLAVIVKEIIIPDAVKADPDSYIEIGEEFHDELEANPGHLYFERTVRKKFRKIDDKSVPPIISAAPESTIPGTMCGADLMAMIISDKYCDHLPHYRQSGRFLRRNGVILCRETINKWTHCAADLLAPIDTAIKEQIPLSDVLQIDETPAKYLVPGLGKAATGYYWFYRDQETGLVYCDWQIGRGHQCVLDVLGYDETSRTLKFNGSIQCDGYSAYITLDNMFASIELGGCLAHIRRYFYDARKQAPDLVDRILKLIQQLYLYERALRRPNEPPPDCRFLVRHGHQKKIVTELKQIIEKESGKHLPKTNLGKAFTYAANQWQAFVRYLDDGRMEIDNNLIENAIRPAKLGLKNYLFIGSAEAGRTSAMMYTLIANCKLHKIDPERYLAEVFRRLTSETTVEQARELTPAKLADEIRAKQPVPLKFEANEEAA
jgi:transposase/uncharacterized coiled-coil protein SlyX